jgi:GPI mannosyltransferase 4
MVFCRQQYSTKVFSISYFDVDHRTFVIAPLSAVPLDESIIDASRGMYVSGREWGLFPVKTISFHINLDDVDLNRENLVETVSRVMGRHGLGVWLLVRI